VRGLLLFLSGMYTQSRSSSTVELTLAIHPRQFARLYWEYRFNSLPEVFGAIPA
jgi:hypothetical protein